MTSVSRDDTHYNEIPAAHRHEGYPGCAYCEALRGLELKAGATRTCFGLDDDSGRPSAELEWVVHEKFDYRNPMTDAVTEVFKVEERNSEATNRYFLVDGQGEIHCANWGGSAESIRVDSRDQMLEGLSFTER